MNLYRIISLESFMDLVTNKRERFVRPCKWEDCYESYLMQRLDSQEERVKLLEKLYKTVSVKDEVATINNFMKIWHAKWWTYAQCWCTEEDSDAMWRIYSYGKHSIQLVSDITHIRNSISPNKTKKNLYSFQYKKVTYDVNENTDIFSEQILDIKKTLNPYEPYYHKRKAFEHENEWRFLINDRTTYAMTSICTQSALINIKRKNKKARIDEMSAELEKFLMKYERINKNDYYIPISSWNKYLKGVRVNPFAEDWYVELIESICIANGIKFLGKSNLYKRK